MSSTAQAKPQLLSWKVGGMDCASCAATIRGAVERLPGVSEVKLSVMAETLSLALDESRTKPAAIEKRVASLGYTTTSIQAKAAPVAETAAPGGCGHDHGSEAHDHHSHAAPKPAHVHGPGCSHDDHDHHSHAAPKPAHVHGPGCSHDDHGHHDHDHGHAHARSDAGEAK